jgi:hypothetical protein
VITVDLLSPGGAFTAANGDTQELTTTFTTSIGSPTLTCNGASPFVSGDTGKYFQIVGPGSAGVSGTILEGTMTFVSAPQVTMSVNATKELAAASAYLIWGNDDSAGMRAFNTWAQAQSDSITLTLGTGSKNFFFTTTDSNAIRAGGFTWNIPNPVTIVGNGPSSTKFFFAGVNKSSGFCANNMYKSGNGNFGSSSIFTARVDTVAAGGTTLQCQTIADALLFTEDTWSLMTGLDLQGDGDPPNSFLYEYVYITDVNTTTGVITIQTALQNTYLDTWPVFEDGTPGGTSDKGGPATLYVLDPGWNVEATFKDLSTNNPYGQSPSKCRDITFDNVTCLDISGHFPSQSKTVTYQNCDMTSFPTMEVDKWVEECIFDNTDANELKFQSSIDRVIFRNGCNITSFNGTPRVLTFNDSTVSGATGMGAIAHGRSDSFTTNGSTFNGALTYFGITDSGYNSGGSTILDDGYTMSSSGLLTMLRAGRSLAGLTWAVPGTRCYFDGRETTGSLRIVDWGPMFTVLSVTADATNIYVQTDWPYSGGLPSWVRRIRVLPSKTINFGSDTVSSQATVQNLVAATAAVRPYPGTYSFASLNGATCGTDIGSASIQVLPPTGGKLVRLTVDVTTPYTGAAPTLSWGKATQFVLAGDGSSFITWNPRFDLKTEGIRVITPSAVTGSVGADSLSVPTADAWLSHWLASMSTGSQNIVAEYTGNPSVGPVFTVELIVDQGIIPTAVAPFWSRLRAS